MIPYSIEKILIPLDFSKTSLKALDHAIHLAELNKAELTLMHAIEYVPMVAEPGYFEPVDTLIELEKGFIMQSDKHLHDIAERIRKKGSFIVKTQTTTGRTHKEIVALAEKMKADIIVMGTHGVSGIREFFAGSNTFRVIKDAKCPVLSIQKLSKDPGFRHILVPFRDKPHSREKVDYAISIAKMYASTVHVLGVATELSEAQTHKLILEADQIKKIMSNSGVECDIRVIADLYVAETTLKYANEIQADLIISMSDLDKMDITEYFTGPYAQQIVNHSPIPVLSIRPSFNTDTIDLRFY